MPEPNNPEIVWERDCTGKPLSDVIAPFLPYPESEPAPTAYPLPSIIISSTTVPEPQGIGYWCHECQKWTNGFPCVLHFQPLPAAGLGWECPRCHAIHAPWVAGCDCQPPMITRTGS